MQVRSSREREAHAWAQSRPNPGAPCLGARAPAQYSDFHLTLAQRDYRALVFTLPSELMSFTIRAAAFVDVG